MCGISVTLKAKALSIWVMFSVYMLALILPSLLCLDFTLIWQFECAQEGTAMSQNSISLTQGFMQVRRSWLFPVESHGTEGDSSPQAGNPPGILALTMSASMRSHHF